MVYDCLTVDTSGHAEARIFLIAFLVRSVESMWMLDSYVFGWSDTDKRCALVYQEIRQPEPKQKEEEEEEDDDDDDDDDEGDASKYDLGADDDEVRIPGVFKAS